MTNRGGADQVGPFPLLLLFGEDSKCLPPVADRFHHVLADGKLEDESVDAFVSTEKIRRKIGSVIRLLGPQVTGSELFVTAEFVLAGSVESHPVNFRKVAMFVRLTV